MEMSPTINWLKQPKFWVFWLLQVGVWFVLLSRNVWMVFKSVFVNAGWSNADQYATMAFTLTVVCIFGAQLLTATVYRRSNFLVLSTLIFLNYLDFAGLAIALGLRVADYRQVTRFRYFAIALAAYILMQLLLFGFALGIFAVFALMVAAIPPQIST